MATNTIRPHVHGITSIYISSIYLDTPRLLDSDTRQNPLRPNGQLIRECMTFTLTEYLDIPGFVYHSLECVRFREGLHPEPERIIKIFHDPNTFTWAKRIFCADREYLEQQHMAIWDLMEQQQDLDISAPFCCLVDACSWPT